MGTKNDNKKKGNLSISDVIHHFNPKFTWEYNLLQQVRWGSDDEKDDVCFYVKNWLEIIANQEGYTLIKK